METMPLPKNVLTFEFKLFGSLSIAQFLRLIGAGIVSLALFVSGLPFLITIPIIAVLLFISGLSVLIPDFSKRVSSFIKYLFASPRYVWQKSNNVPDIFKVQEAKTGSKSTDKAVKQENTDLAGIDLDRFIASTVVKEEKDTEDEIADILGENPSTALDDIYQKEFSGDTIQTRSDNSSQVQPVQKQSIQQISSNENSDSSATRNDAELLNELKNQLAQTTDIERREELIDQIDRMTAQRKLNLSQQAAARYTPKQESIRSLYGIVVDKDDSPLASAKVILQSMDQSEIAASISNREGKFQIDFPANLQSSDYVIQIELQGYKFDKYKIQITEKSLPIYKFRSK
jgi:hypothetical protein